ncbi:SDH family Clp fold serine proteinase [Candidatus Spongiihabitans sp.]|uniref:SDH family Clp fold serine proteinase n=1 Tax=Candidatus Spongiihabitans sp. TaxID=3101308 RepID=UPI003C797E8F
MADWTELVNKLTESKDPLFIQHCLIDELTKISKLHDDSNVVYYASGFLQKPTESATSITREDVNGFMNAFHGLDCTKGLVLIVHTPGGDIHAVESIVAYLHQKFDRITAVVPYLAMSGGSMISLACDAIVLGKQSQLGPTDPQIVIQNKQHSARAIQDAFNRAKSDIQSDVTLAHLWAPILQSMGPSLIIEAEKALGYSQSLVSKWLQKRMFRLESDPKKKADKVADHVNADSENVYAHGQRMGIEDLQQLGVNVIPLEDNQQLQEAVLSAYHAMTIIFEQTPSSKFIVNHNGKMWSKSVQQVILQASPVPPPAQSAQPARHRRRK